MLKLALVSAVSALCGATATFQSLTASVVADDRCHVLGYRVCMVVDGVSRPSTFDPKARAELTQFVRQIRRDKL